MKVTIHYLTSASLHVHTGGHAICTSVGAVLRMRDRYPLVINPQVYIHLPFGSQDFQINGLGKNPHNQ
jgi:hypothetical protein